MATAANQTPDPVGRRAAIRRARNGGGGFGGGSSARSDGYPTTGSTEAEPDEVDNAIDPDAQPGYAVARPAGQPPDPDTNNPRARLQAVQMAGSPAYAKEHRLRLMAKLLMRGVSLDTIAQQLQVSISTAERYRAELKTRFREDSRKLNIDEMIGSNLAFYDEVTEQGLRLSSAGDVPAAMKLAALRTSLAANADRTRFLNSAGVFDALRFKQAEDANQMSDVQALMARTREALAAMDDDTPDADPGEAPAPRVVRRRRGARAAEGFDKMSWNDRDATGSANEVEII